MNIRRKIEKLFVGFHGDGAKGTLKKMPALSILCIKVFCVSVLDALKVTRDSTLFFFLHKKMKVIWHNCKCA